MHFRRNYRDRRRLTMKKRGLSGVPMADNEQERKRPVPVASVKRAVPRLIVSALLEESGEVAPVDFGRFGRNAGQIIARGASARHPGSGGKSANGRRSRAFFGGA
jgi:hypothetical protein